MDPLEEHYYLTDDCDQDDMEMRVSRGGNGDWYLSVCRRGDHATNHCVRITTSGSRYPGAANAVLDLWTAMSTNASRHLAMAGGYRKDQSEQDRDDLVEVLKMVISEDVFLVGETLPAALRNHGFHVLAETVERLCPVNTKDPTT